MQDIKLTEAIIKQYLPKLKFTKYHRTYTIRPNKRAGIIENFQITVRSASNPHEISICVLETLVELKAIYKLITKVKIEEHGNQD